MRTRQTEVRFLVGTEYLDNLKARLGESKTTDAMRAALAILDWASEEVEQGRVILSTNQQGGDIHRLVMPALNQVKSLVTTRD